MFGLFPVFRRYIKHISWGLHVILTISLVLGAAVGLGVMVGWGWAVMWCFSVLTGMVGCAWWMIDLQKYKKYVAGVPVSFVAFALEWIANYAAVRFMGRGTRRGLSLEGNGSSVTGPVISLQERNNVAGWS